MISRRQRPVLGKTAGAIEMVTGKSPVGVEESGRYCSAKSVDVFQARACIVENNAFVSAYLAVVQERSESREGGRTLRRCKNAFGLADFSYGAQQVFVGHRDCGAITPAKDVEHYKIADRFRDSQTGSDCLRVVDVGPGGCSGMKCLYDWSAAF